MIKQRCHQSAALLALIGALAANPASAYVQFYSASDTLGMNYDLSSLIDPSATAFDKVSFSHGVWGPDSGFAVDVFTDASGTGTKVYSGLLTDLDAFTQPGMTDGVFSAVLSFTGSGLPWPGIAVDLKARGLIYNLNGNYFSTNYVLESSTFVPTTSAVPEAETYALALAGMAVVSFAVSRRRQA